MWLRRSSQVFPNSRVSVVPGRTSVLGAPLPARPGGAHLAHVLGAPPRLVGAYFGVHHTAIFTGYGLLYGPGLLGGTAGVRAALLANVKKIQ